jgi:hypothetical protein
MIHFMVSLGCRGLIKTGKVVAVLGIVRRKKKMGSGLEYREDFTTPFVS